MPIPDVLRMACAGEIIDSRCFEYVIMVQSQYYIRIVPSSIIQKMWDHHLQQSNLFLILIGSLAGIIQRTALDYHAPLYGRVTARLKL